MASFDIALKITGGNEGGYSNDSLDSGGETLFGISRKWNPQWSGWTKVDQIKLTKPKQDWNKIMVKDDELILKAKAYYKIMYWDTNRLTEVQDQSIANELYDTGVNMSVSAAARFIQRALNISNKNQTAWRDILVDGKIGAATLGLINSHPNKKALFKILNIMQGAEYIRIMETTSTQERFVYGWMDRVIFN